MNAKMKKMFSTVLVIALTAAISISGTLAYLTDRDSKANVFSVGDVEIELNEDFEQGATLTPGVDIEKEPTITNTGKNDAWVWATIAIPGKLDNDDASKNVIHFNYSGESVEEGLWKWTDSEGNWRISTVTIDEVEYNLYTVLYQTPLKANETTSEPVIYKVYMDPHVDIDPNGDWYHVENGTAEALDWNVEKDGNPIIYVSAYAIQTEGFETVQDAYEAYTKQWGDQGTEWGTSTIVDDEKTLKEALEAGENVALAADVKLDKEEINITEKVVIDLNGFELDASANESRPFVLEEGAELTINAEGTDVVCGEYGLVKMTGGDLTINGGNFTGEIPNGAFLKVEGESEMNITLNNVSYKATAVDSGVLRTSGSNVTLNVKGGEYEAGMGFLISKGTIDGAKITATNTANMWPAVYANGEGVKIINCEINSACHAIAVANGNTVDVENCNVSVPEGELAFQVFSSGGTINVINCTYNGGYGTTGKMKNGAVAIINIDGEEVYRKTSK